MTETKLNVTPSRRKLLGGAAALAAAGWIGGATGGWLLRPRRAHAAGPIKMGIATDITGPIAAAGNCRLAGRPVHGRGNQQGRRHQRPAYRTLSRRHRLRPEDRRRQRPPAYPGTQGRRRARWHHQRHAPGDQGPDRQPRPHALHLSRSSTKGQECTKDLFCTGPTPAQQCDKLIPYLIKTVGKKRFAMPSANYVWPQLLNKYARKVIEANGGEVVFEEYYPARPA